MPEVLIVDDEPHIREALTGILEAESYEVAAVADGQAALDQVMTDPPGIIILDLRMPGLGGMETLRKLKEVAPLVPVIMLTGYGDIHSAVQAMRLGAEDYLTKPVQTEQLVLPIRRALEHRELVAEIEGLRKHLGEAGPLRELMSPSREVQKVIHQIKQVAQSNFTVLIEGETGTGKELVARAIHHLSPRREKPFIALDCGAIPETLVESELFGYERGAFTGADRQKEGHFQLAEGGSLFLDEIVNLPFTIQSKLLRVLQERQVQPLGSRRPVPVDVRVITASNVPLEREMRAGRFRQDLYYRLNEFVIMVPPLRERQEDILYWANRFLAEASTELRRPVRGISEEAVQRLAQYSWPGNVRELRNVIRRAVLLGSELIRPEDLLTLSIESAQTPSVAVPSPPVPGLSLKEIAATAAAEAERRAIRQVLRTTRGNKSQAARLLGIDYKTLHFKLKRLGIDARAVAP